MRRAWEIVRATGFTRGCRTNPNRGDRSPSPYGLTIRPTSDSSTRRSSCKPFRQPCQSYLSTGRGPCRGHPLCDSLRRREHTPVFLSPGLLRRAAAIDARFADLGLGFVDASVMAYAERHELPILTFDFHDFRAATPERGHWRL